jgi:Prokaryotic homologs of the JAB domain
MRRREACFVVGSAGTLLYADLSGSALALPDSRARWEALWRHRGEVREVAHSHPVGPDAFSEEDLTTMAAVDAALGRPLTYSVVSPGGRLVYRAGHPITAEEPSPWWLPLLLAASGMDPAP